MKVSLSQPELSQLASLAGNVVPSKSTLPILSTILLEAKSDGIHVSATDLDLSINVRADAEIGSEGSVAVPARRFAEIVRKLESVDVVDFRRLDSRDGVLNLTYLVVCDDPGTVNAMVDKLKATLPITEISLLQQEQVLGG